MIGCIIPLPGFDKCNVGADGNIAAGTALSAADSRGVISAPGLDRASVNGNIAAGASIASSDAGTTFTALSLDGATADGDGAARAVIAASNAGSTRASAIGGDGSSVNDYVTTIDSISTANTCSVLTILR